MRNKPFDHQEEVFEDLAFDSLRDYIGKVLVDKDGNRYRMTQVERINYHEVDYYLEGMPIPWRSKLGDLLNETGLAYGRALARGYNTIE